MFKSPFFLQKEGLAWLSLESSHSAILTNHAGIKESDTAQQQFA